jgi:multimeric flavodoxin WrbA
MSMPTEGTAMRFCILVGSSRADGQSRGVCELIRDHLAGAAYCDFVYLREHRIELCDADNACMHMPCAINDDVQAIVARMLAADAVVYMPVVHAYGTNSRFQAFLERAGYGYLRPLDRPLKDKLAGVVVIGRRYGHTAVYAQVVLNIMLNKMVLVGSGFPATFMGVSGGRYDSEAVEALQEMLNRMIELSARIAAPRVPPAARLDAPLEETWRIVG